MPAPTRRRRPEPPSFRRSQRVPAHGARAVACRHRLLTSLVAIAMALVACNKKPPAPPSAAPADPSASPPALAALAHQLAAARVDAATTCLEKNARDEALALLVSALKAEPAATEAAALIRQLLAESVWNIPVATIRHQVPVEQLAFDPPATLWVSLAEPKPEGFNTTVRWDTEALKMTSVLFPARGAATRSLVVGQRQHALVVQRGSGPDAVTLLCDANTLRPIRALGPLPDDLTPQSAIASSANGLLIAHPEPASASDPQLLWRIRDAATGEVIRSSEPPGGDAVRPLAAHLDSRRLRILHADGSLLDLPVSPVEPACRFPPAVPLALLHAHFSPDGGTVLALSDQGSAHAPERRFYQISSPSENAAPQVEPAAFTNSKNPAALPQWVLSLPWSRQPSVWTGLLRDHGNPDDPPPIHIQGSDLRYCGSPRAPIHSESPIAAVAFGPDLAIIGTGDGGVFVHRFLPLPTAVAIPQAPGPPGPPGPPDPASLGLLADILAGVRFDEATRTCLRLTARHRLNLLEKLPPGLAAGLVPGLDFTATLTALKATVIREAPAAALLPLWDRLARSDPSAKSWPRLLELARALGDTRWHQDLTEAVALHARTAPAAQAVRADDPSPWLAQIRLRETFRTHDDAAILKAIHAVGGKGPAAATALATALGADAPEWLEVCLKSAVDLPPLLRLLGDSRLAWLQHRTADAISLWPEEFPSYAKSRLTEDWDGWEQADFAPCYEAHQQAIKGELATYEVAAAATPAERTALAARLLDPAARGIIGRRRLADRCLQAALALAAFPDHSAVTCQLANRARSLGAQAAPCLRAEALALTRLGDYKSAHPCWVTLLTEHPVATHLSGDYAEAAYTAFENGDPNQALEILTTGVRRFPEDAGFALRAGWIALLTINYQRAYQFLLAGLRIGYPADQRENACLLLTVAAALAGFPEDAATHYQNLLDLAPIWAEAGTIEALEWPEELKTPMLELAR
ncbi:MAG: hypothetical protein NTW21_34550 [Verrucomicrobia bacterium]|nr:hypothetical protein [Verrucomicrobiota bacterium]